MQELAPQIHEIEKSMQENQKKMLEIQSLQ
jgi:hypothetical protein